MEFNNFPYHNYVMIMSALRQYGGNDFSHARAIDDKLQKSEHIVSGAGTNPVVTANIDLSDKDIEVINKSLKDHIRRFETYIKSNTEDNARKRQEINLLQREVKSNTQQTSELKADIRMMKGLLTSRFPASKSSTKAPKTTKLPSNKMLNQRAFK